MLGLMEAVMIWVLMWFDLEFVVGRVSLGRETCLEYVIYFDRVVLMILC